MSALSGDDIRPSWPRRAMNGVVLLASIGFLVTLAIEHAGELSSLPWNNLDLIPLALALVLYASTIILLGIGWHLWLRSLDQPTTLRTAVCVVAVSQIAKYLPGNVGHWIGRVAMSVTRGVPAVAAVYALGLETLWAIFASGGVVVFGWLVFAMPGADGLNERELLMLLGAAGGALAGAYALPRVVRQMPPGWRAKLGLDEALKSPGSITSLACLAIYLASWGCNGVALGLVMEAGFTTTTPGLVWAGTVYATAWLSGYLLPGAPGGLGAREAVLVLLLAPVLGSGAALGVALVMRLITSTGDLLVFSLGWSLRVRPAIADEPSLPRQA